MNTDPIADLLTRIKNGYMAKKVEVMVPHSNVKEHIVEVLDKYNFVDSFAVEGDGIEKRISIALQYDASDASPAMESFKRKSKPSVRTYIKNKEVREVMNGYGISIVSTSKGIMAGHEAREQGIGGELIAEVW